MKKIKKVSIKKHFLRISSYLYRVEANRLEHRIHITCKLMLSLYQVKLAKQDYLIPQKLPSQIFVSNLFRFSLLIMLWVIFIIKIGEKCIFGIHSTTACTVGSIICQKKFFYMLPLYTNTVNFKS